MNNIQVFENAQFGQIRTAVTESGEPLFCLADLCKSLNLTTPSKVKQRLDEGDVNQIHTPTESGVQHITYVTEPGMYTVILRSDSPKAKPMQKWVTSEVLPALRKTGGYMVARTDETPEQIMARALIVAQDTIKRTEERARQLEAESERLTIANEQANQTILTQAPKVRAFEDMISSEGLININKIAAEFGMSAIKRNKILCQRGVQYKQGDSFILYQKYKDRNYATLRAHPYLDSNGNNRSRMHLYWTQAGRAFIHTLLSDLQKVAF